MNSFRMQRIGSARAALLTKLISPEDTCGEKRRRGLPKWGDSECRRLMDSGPADCKSNLTWDVGGP